MSRTRLFFAFLLLAFAALPARAQYVYGVTALQLDTELDHAYGYSATALDYTACYYYDAAVFGGLYEGTGTELDWDYYHGICTAEVYTDSPTQDNVAYTQYSEHYLIAYYYYYYYGGYYDPWGFFGFGAGGDYGGGFNHYGCYCPAFFAQSEQDLGSTQVTLFNPGPADPRIEVSPSSVSRGEEATFSVTTQEGDVVSGWRFSDGTHAVTSGSTASSWKGVMVTSGTVTVNVKRGNRNIPLSQSITVNPRSNFAFTAKLPTEYPYPRTPPGQPPPPPPFTCVGETPEKDIPLKVPDPPTLEPPTLENRRFGYSITCLRYGWQGAAVNSGPNQGYRYVGLVTDSSGGTPPQTTFAWTITPQLNDPQSDLYRAQCGRDGYISGAQLQANTIAHESGSVNSHYSRYVQAQNSHNYKAGLEAFLGFPGESDEQFSNRVKAEARARRDAILTPEEPCGVSDVSLDPACHSHGNINWYPYRPCSPLNLTAQVVSPTQVDLSWIDGSFNETGFRIEQREAPNGTWYQVGTAGEDDTNHSDDDDVEPSKTYDYRVVALASNTNFFSFPSNVVRVTTPAPPGSMPPPTQPGYLGGGASPGLINLGWTDSSNDENGFRIERSTAGGPFIEIGSVGAGITWYSDTAINYSTSYTYQVRAWNAGGASNPSPPVTVLSLAPGSAPTPPCCVWGYNSYYGMGSLTLGWNDLSNNEDVFAIERNDGWGGDFYAVGWVSPNTTSYTDYGLQQGQTYIYRIVAENAWGPSYSEEMYYTSPYWWEQ